MNDARQSETVHGPSADATDKPLVQAAAVACTYLTATQQSQKNQAYAVLTELASRTLTQAREGKPTEFLASNLKVGVAPDATKEPSGWLSPLWTRLTDDEPQWQEGLIDTARTLGLGFVPKLVKKVGSPALYSLEAVPIPAEDEPDPVAPIPAGGLRYTAAAVAAPAAWLSGALRSGVVKWSVGLRWVLLGGIFAMTLMVLGLFWLTVTMGLQVVRPISVGDVTGVLVAVSLLATLVPVYRFLDDLFDLRIVMAPSFLTPLSQDHVTLEFRRSAPGDDNAELAFVRYTSTCPSCGGSVALYPGRAAFPDRLVGRCLRSAREHVFSFDPVSRVGRPLIA
jgi:hypothetical protein